MVSSRRSSRGRATTRLHPPERPPPSGIEWLLRRLRPDREAALRQYQWRAPAYDFQLMFARPARELAVTRLGLKRGDTVIDVGCGTGLSFPLLEERIGPHGRIIGIEQSPEMIGQARDRTKEHGWHNVTLVLSPAEEADIHVAADAALFCFTHDIMRMPKALDNIFRHLKPGARVVATGLKWAPGWNLPANLMVLYGGLASTTSLEGLRQPWSYLADRVSAFKVEQLFTRTVYLATGIAHRPPHH